MEIIKPILNGLAIIVFIGGATIAILVNIIMGLVMVVMALEFVIMARLMIPQGRVVSSMSPPMDTHNILKKLVRKPETIVQPQPNIVSQPTQMPITIEKPVNPVDTAKGKKDTLEANRLAEEAIMQGEEAIKRAEKELQKEPETPVFQCKRCADKGVEKIFQDEKRLKRHIGMAHYQDLEI